MQGGTDWLTQEENTGMHWPLCVEFVCFSPHVWMSFLQVLRFYSSTNNNTQQVNVLVVLTISLAPLLELDPRALMLQLLMSPLFATVKAAGHRLNLHHKHPDLPTLSLQIFFCIPQLILVHEYNSLTTNQLEYLLVKIS